jgi:hypothetical protein
MAPVCKIGFGSGLTEYGSGLFLLKNAIFLFFGLHEGLSSCGTAEASSPKREN